MRPSRPSNSAVLVCGALCLALGAGTLGCIRFSDEPGVRSDAGDGGPSDTGVADAPTESGPPCDPDAGAPGSLCDKYGGMGTVKALTKELIGTIAADCRINQHFLTLPAPRLAFVQECLELQLGQLLGCACVTYPAKTSKGEQCRDMKTSHAGKGISGDDFGALLDDAVATMKKLGVSDADIAKVGAVLGSSVVKNDVVEKTTPGHTKGVCDGGVDGGDGGAEAGAPPY
jgi:hypothetical protein